MKKGLIFLFCSFLLTGIVMTCPTLKMLFNFAEAQSSNSQKNLNPNVVDLQKNPNANLDGVTITILHTYFWRDWMPIVNRPGKDRGSPLRGKIKLGLDNSTESTKKLSFTVAVIDEEGLSHEVPFQVEPDNNSIWNGVLKQGESREIVILTKEGPYLPAGSRIYAIITWKDQNGVSGSVKTLVTPIIRTD